MLNDCSAVGRSRDDRIKQQMLDSIAAAGSGYAGSDFEGHDDAEMVGHCGIASTRHFAHRSGFLAVPALAEVAVTAAD